MKKLCNLKKSAQLRKSTPLRPVMRNKTRWSSTFAMVERFCERKMGCNIGFETLAARTVNNDNRKYFDNLLLSL